MIDFDRLSTLGYNVDVIWTLISQWDKSFYYQHASSTLVFYEICVRWVSQSIDQSINRSINQHSKQANIRQRKSQANISLAKRASDACESPFQREKKNIK